MRLSWAPSSVSAPVYDTDSLVLFTCIVWVDTRPYAGVDDIVAAIRLSVPCWGVLPLVQCLILVALLWLPESEFLTGVFVSLHHHGSAPLICVCTNLPSYRFLTSLRPKWISALIITIRCCIYFLVRRMQDNATRKKQRFQKASAFTSKQKASMHVWISFAADFQIIGTNMCV